MHEVLTTPDGAVLQLAARLRACGDTAAELGMHAVSIDCHAEARAVEAQAAPLLYVGAGLANVSGLERALIAKASVLDPPVLVKGSSSRSDALCH